MDEYIEIPRPAPGRSDSELRIIARRIAGYSLKNAARRVRANQVASAADELNDAIRRLHTVISLAGPEDRGPNRVVTRSLTNLSRSPGFSRLAEDERTIRHAREWEARLAAGDQTSSDRISIQCLVLGYIETLQENRSRIRRAMDSEPARRTAGAAQR